MRALRNNLVFVAADDARKGDMRSRMFRRLALQALKQPERLADLADHQQDKVRELEARSEQELAIAIQQCYRHLFYPSRNRIEASAVDLAHSAMDGYSASERPGEGQREIVRALRDLNKLRLAEDEPDSPAYVRDRTPLKNGQITTAALRDEFRRDPGLPMLSGDDIFIRGVRRGVELGEYVYRRGELLFGPGDPAADVIIDERALVFTMAYARNAGIWPRPEKPAEDSAPDAPGGTQPTGGGASATGTGRGTIRETPGGTGYRADAFTAEGVLREALVKLWEQARNREVAAIGVLEIRMFEAGDGFRLLGAVGAVPGAEKVVTMRGGYETGADGSFELDFRGPVPDAQPVREFLEPQLRDARTTSLEIGFRLRFADGLPMRGDAAEKLAERLTRLGSAAAYVSAVAEPHS